MAKSNSVRINVFVKKLRGKTYALFYDEEDIADGVSESGLLYILTAAGDIEFTIDGKMYRNRYTDIERAISEHKLTDAKLLRLENSGRLEWLMNNWFEITCINPKTRAYIYTVDEVAHTYNEGIKLLRDEIALDGGKDG